MAHCHQMLYMHLELSNNSWSLIQSWLFLELTGNMHWLLMQQHAKLTLQVVWCHFNPNWCIRQPLCNFFCLQIIEGPRKKLLSISPWSRSSSLGHGNFFSMNTLEARGSFCLPITNRWKNLVICTLKHLTDCKLLSWNMILGCNTNVAPQCQLTICQGCHVLKSTQQLTPLLLSICSSPT